MSRKTLPAPPAVGQDVAGPVRRPGGDQDPLESKPSRSGHGVCVWFTGLSGSGKSTTAKALTAILSQGVNRVTLLDGDEVRARQSRDLGFSRRDRDTNVLRVGLMAREAVHNGDIAVCATISPYAAARERVRNMIGAHRFVEVYVNTPLAVCEERDPKGLYALARCGEIKGFTGIDDPYEAPAAPDVELDTLRHGPEDNARVILAELQARGFAGRDSIRERY